MFISIDMTLLPLKILFEPINLGVYIINCNVIELDLSNVQSQLNMST